MSAIKTITAAIIMLSAIGYGGNGKGTGSTDGSVWRPGPSPEWFVNWDKALAEARKTGKTMFVLKTGDWSSVQGDLMKQVLQKDKFLEFAGKNLVLVYLNDAKCSPLGKEQRKHNWFITEALAYGHAHQELRLFNPDGIEIKSDINCREQLDEFLEKLKRVLANRQAKPVVWKARRLFSEGYDKVASEFFLNNDLFATSTNEFKVALTGIAASRRSGRNGSEEVFLPPGNEIEVPWGTSARFRIEYDVPDGFKVQFLVWENPDSDSRMRSRTGFNYSRWCTGKGVAYTFLSLMKNAESHRVRNVQVRIATEPALDGLPYGWMVMCVPVNINFMAESAMQKANRPNVSKYVPKGWLEDFEAARRLAAKEGKFVLVAFSGSDWCGPCMTVEREVFSQKEFVDAASKKFVLTMVAVPRDDSTLSQLAVSQNDGLKKRYAVRSYPTVVIVNPADGEVVKRHSGYRSGSVQDYMNRLEELLGGVQWPRPGEVVKKLVEIPGAQGGERPSPLNKSRPKRAEKKMEYDKNMRLSVLEQCLSAEKAVACAKEGGARGFYQLAILYAKKASEYDSASADRAKSVATSDKCLAKAADMGYGNALFLRAIDLAHRNLFRTRSCGRHRHANDWYRCAGMDRCNMENTDLDQSTMLIDAFTNRTVVAEVVAAFDQAAKAGVTNAVLYASYITNDLSSAAAIKLRKRDEEARESTRIDAEVDGLLNGRAEVTSVEGQLRGSSAKEAGTAWATPKDNGAHLAQLESQFPFDEAVRMASKGDGSGLYSLALHYASGLEIAQDGKRAAKYLEKAIDAKNGNAALVKALLMEDDLGEGTYFPRRRLLNVRMSRTADETPHSRIRKYTGHDSWVFTFSLPLEHGGGFHATNDAAVAIVRSAYKKAVDLGCPSAKEEEERFERRMQRMREKTREEDAEKQAWIAKVNANARLAQELLGEPPEKNPVYDKSRHAAKRDRGLPSDDAEAERRKQREALLQLQEELRKRRLEKER